MTIFYPPQLLENLFQMFAQLGRFIGDFRFVLKNYIGYGIAFDFK
jgi:hypothetical protein